MSPVFAPASDQTEYELPEPNRYIAVCLDIEDAPDKGFGAGVKWVFQLIDPNTNQPVKNSKGYDFTLWQWTSTKMGPKARARPIIEALLGRSLENGEVPDSRLLLNKGMICLVAHEPTQNGGVVARVTSCKPYNPAADAAKVAPTGPAPAPGGAPTSDLEALREVVRKNVSKCDRLTTPSALAFSAMNVDGMSEAELRNLLAESQAEIDAA
jgi:hypothetical protein